MAGAMTYRKAGVDVAGADAWLSRMRGVVRSTWNGARVLPDLGQFAGLFHLKALRLRNPVLVASTDGVGTKLHVARLARAHEGIGVDVVAMNTNDVLAYGARPLFFLDYIAIGRLQPRILTALLRGVAEGCRQSGCALLGGETAEMPGAYGPEAYDVAGFCVGAVERAKLIDGTQVRAGDAIVGLASSGVHANGFSLIRRVMGAAQLRRLSRQLLTPTRIYVKPVLEALTQISVRAIAHVTGGGLTRRLPSLVARSRGVRAQLVAGSWPVPPIFGVIQRQGGIDTDEMRRTFNMGIGLALVCPARQTSTLIRIMRRHGVPAWPIGTIVRSRS